MQFVKIERTESGYFLDPSDYLARVNEFGPRLPVGAAAFAADSGHYDFYGAKCVKDLNIRGIHLVDDHGLLTLDIDFEANEHKHDAGLFIQYKNLVRVSIDVTSELASKNDWPETRRLGSVQLDEILPHEMGCSHEIKMTGGTIHVVSGDLRAEWR